LIDSEDGWAETWTEVDAQIGASFKLSTAFRCVNVTKPPNMINMAKAFDADLFASVFFLSEMYSYRAEAASFFNALANAAKKGALFLYIDNSSQQFTDYAASILAPNGFAPIYNLEKTTLQISPDEEKKDLGEYLELIERTPKLTSHATCQIWRKD